MKNTLNILLFIAIVIGFASCSKDDEEAKNPKDTAELIGKWARIDGTGGADTSIVDGPHLDTIKIIEFLDAAKVKVSRGECCNFGTKRDKNQEAAYEYYSVNNSELGGTADRIKFDKCNRGMPVVVHGNTLRLGYGTQSGAFEEYRKVTPADTTGTPEIPTEPTDPGNTEG